MTISSDSSKMRWIDLINESVHSSDDIDIGDIDAVSRDFIVVKRGFVNVHYYYIPFSKVEGWDSQVVWLTITESEFKADYERDTIPDPARYYVKDYPVYNSTSYPEVVMIQSRYKRPAFTTSPSNKTSRIYKCDLCDTSFRSDEELSNCVKTLH